ncbi:unnamed protein product [Phytophthora fragariaefolia]|uniref:Unnamed protein product n=1 Tax=Phytophthora fragariaefolia TaxID=1490495 RepID=A0A9W6XPE9_9STRA|nr:unnamed protein product [Phytophthora fragariaefolia]
MFDLLLAEKKSANGAAVVHKRRYKHFVASLLGEHVTTPNSSALSTILSACIGVDAEGTSMSYKTPFPYQSYGQVASVLDKKEIWLRDFAKKSEPYSSLSPRQHELNRYGGSRENAFLPKYTKPFCVSSDSVVMQLREVGSAVTKKIDPMKILCQYELNGVCNDKNCSNYHQKDYEAATSKDCTDDSDKAKVQQVDEVGHLLSSFAEFRSRIMAKWPLITTSRDLLPVSTMFCA